MFSFNHEKFSWGCFFLILWVAVSSLGFLWFLWQQGVRTAYDLGMNRYHSEIESLVQQVNTENCAPVPITAKSGNSAQIASTACIQGVVQQLQKTSSSEETGK